MAQPFSFSLRKGSFGIEGRPSLFSDRGDSRLSGESELCVLRCGGRGQPRSTEAVRRTRKGRSKRGRGRGGGGGVEEEEEKEEAVCPHFCS